MGSAFLSGSRPARRSNTCCGFPQNKYKDYVKKHLAQGSYTTLPETPNTIRVKEVTKHVSDVSDSPRALGSSWAPWPYDPARPKVAVLLTNAFLYVILFLPSTPVCDHNFELWLKGQLIIYPIMATMADVGFAMGHVI